MHSNSIASCAASYVVRVKMRISSLVLCVGMFKLCACDAMFTSPGAGDTLYGGVPFNVTWTDSYVVPLLANYDDRYSIGLSTGSDSHPVREFHLG